jgi:hypothetical protein
VWRKNHGTGFWLFISKPRIFIDVSIKARLASFFEGLGWKVFTVPETASVLLNGGVKFTELDHEQTYQFQKDL